ncbi:MAG TPA: protein translocase subunit SecD [Aliidongia sp.]|nr:protein translocase subunit SecD [Aliidongia sp.]
MLNFQPWKTWTVIVICLLGVLLALPNAVSRQTLDRLPGWVPAKQVSLGLDLQGGSHLLYEVDLKSVTKERLNGALDVLRTELLKEKIGYTNLSVGDDKLSVALRDPNDLEKLKTILHDKVDVDLRLTQAPNGAITVAYTPESIAARARTIIEQSIEIIRRRVDETGTKEPTIQREGDDRILVQLPGIDDPERVKALIGKTAKMTFQLVDTNVSPEDAEHGKLPPGDEIVPSDENNQRAGAANWVVRKRVVVEGGDLVSAEPTMQDAQWVISFKFNTSGGRKFGDVTKENIGKPFAIILDHKAISVPVIQSAILGGSGVITGSFTAKSASDLALLLRAGALPAPLSIIEERTVGPDLGADSIRAGTIASLVAIVLVATFMLLFYGLFGVYANIALFFNLCLLMAALSVLGATLTLPGIAGIALTMGMAVDANVLVNERIREEMKNGRGVISSIDAGFTRAYATIVDANVTHFIAGAFLFELGSGPVKGFAVTLCLGIATSLFTTIMVSRLLVVWWLRGRPKMLPI